jgi:hypothetical protein
LIIDLKEIYQRAGKAFGLAHNQYEIGSIQISGTKINNVQIHINVM